MNHEWPFTHLSEQLFILRFNSTESCTANARISSSCTGVSCGEDFPLASTPRSGLRNLSAVFSPSCEMRQVRSVRVFTQTVVHLRIDEATPVSRFVDGASATWSASPYERLALNKSTPQYILNGKKEHVPPTWNRAFIPALEQCVY
jgi:hypothetical protein